ncbi:MAG: acyl-CoA carboxylase subunit beta [Dehalococcoidia bacterium]
MSWQPEVLEIERRRARAFAMGGEEKVARHHSMGKLTIRERIAELTDPGSFMELGVAAGSYLDQSDESFTPDAYICGLATIDGRQVVVGGEDFTIKGGTEGSKKPHLVEKLAGEYQIPLVLLHDGAGFNIGTLLNTRGVSMPTGLDWTPLIDLLGTVPVVAGIMGSVAGGPAGRAMLSHWSVMVKDTSELFAGGPPVVKRAIGLDVKKHDLGGSQIHTRLSGAVANEAEDEHHCIEMIRQFLSYFPSSIWQLPPYRAPTDLPDRREEELLTIIPRNRKRGYDMRKLVRLVIDDGELFEIHPNWAGSLITGLARMNGHVVGILANNPMVRAGAMTVEAADKQIHFMELCDQFGIPLVYFVDVPGLMVGPEAESTGLIRKGMTALWMLSKLTVPLFNVNVRRCYGFGGTITRRQGHTIGFAWPSAEFGGIPIEGGVDAAFRRIIEEAPDPEAKRAEIGAKLQRLISPFPAAEALGIEDIIDPRDTRPRLIRAIEAAVPGMGRHLGPRPKTGVRP